MSKTTAIMRKHLKKTNEIQSLVVKAHDLNNSITFVSAELSLTEVQKGMRIILNLMQGN